MYKDASPFLQLFPKTAIIGAVHLKPLPGSPYYDGNLRDVTDAALEDADAYARGGADGLIIENFFDAPFFKDQVGAETIAAMTKVVTFIRQRTNLPIGINVLRNDGMSAMAIATVCQCQFIRVNQLTAAMLTDQGIIEGRAAEILRYRSLLRSDVLVFADCLTKHASPLAPQSMEIVAHETWERGGANGLIISGAGTGRMTELHDVEAAQQGAPQAPILIGSGVTKDNLHQYMSASVNGFIVGTYFKRDGKIENPVDVDRVRELVEMKQMLESL